MQLRHTSVNNDLLLGRQVREDVLLDPPQEEWPQDLVKLSDGLVLSLFLKDVFLGRGALALLSDVAKAEPALEDVKVVEDLWVDEVQETPEL